MSVESTLVDMAKDAARDEVRRLGIHVSPYVIGRIIEVSRAVFAGRPPVDWAEDVVLDLIGVDVDDDVAAGNS